MTEQEQSGQVGGGIFLDTRYSMSKNVAGGVSDMELRSIVESPHIASIHKQLLETFEKRSQPGHGFETDLGVINSAYDTELRETVKQTLEDISDAGITVTDVVLAGIGGSELGATAVISACGTTDVNYHPITSLNNDNISRILGSIDPKGTVLIEVSRSGTTKETLTAYKVVIFL